ncbi:MAG: glycosyltransferase [Thermaceae bacterium]|nr:glycosyltransferase [Thermaceae bacterium]
MRFLFTCQPAFGHFHPLVPLARALHDAGHELAFACSVSFCSTVRAAGFLAFPCGLDWLESSAADTFPALREMSLEDQRSRFVSDIFGGATATATVPDVIALGNSWQPDVIVRDYWEFGGFVAAEHLNLPHATVGLGTFIPQEPLAAMLAGPLARLCRAYAVPFALPLGNLYKYLYLHLAPPSYLPAQETVPVAHALRPLVFDRAGGEQLPGWLEQLSANPRVYATLGTVYNKTAGVFEAILEGLRDEPLNLILTVGRDRDPGRFGPQPANVHIEHYIPQTLLLPSCDIVISHGGYNTVMAAISYGLPQILLPISADQPTHASICQRLGIAVVLDPAQMQAADIRQAVRAVLAGASYRTNTHRLQQEMQALPTVDYAVDLLERLARDRQPIFA